MDAAAAAPQPRREPRTWDRSGERGHSGVALAAGTRGVQLRERAGVPAARQGSLSLR